MTGCTVPQNGRAAIAASATMTFPYLKPDQRCYSGCYLQDGAQWEKVALSRYGGVAQLVERLTGSQEVRGFESHRLHSVMSRDIVDSRTYEG
jgi:hypothetical protein